MTTQDPPTDAPVPVVCIIGFGRSGSTVLDTVLGNAAGVASFGELVNLPTRGWTNDEYCACGQRARSCPFWTRVRARAGASGFPDDLAAYTALQRLFERSRSLPRLLRERRSPSPDWRRYAQWTAALYLAIRDESGASVLVDSSKYAVRAFALAGVPGLDVRLVHLVRDPRAVAWSLLQSHARDDAAGVQRDIAGRPAGRSAWDWVKSNLAAAVVRGIARLPGTEIRYEDFVSAPEATLRAIGRTVGLDLSELARRVAAGETMVVGHTIAGSRVRMQGALRLSADVAWTRRLSPRDRRVVELLTAPLLLRFGYPLLHATAVPAQASDPRAGA